MQSDILKFTEEPLIDTGIAKYECHSYGPVPGTNLDFGEITINIVKEDLFTHVAESYVLFEGRLTKEDGSAYANADEVAITNNGLMHLFSEISYSLSDQKIETVRHPGQATTMLGLLKYRNSSDLLNQLWAKDTTTTASLQHNAGFAARHAELIKNPAVKGTFRFIIPMKHIFGFCEDYDKVIYGMSHTLTFVRKSDNDAIFRLAAAGAGKVLINRILWFVPHVTPSDMERLSMFKVIQSKVSLPVAYRTHRCHTIAVPQATTFSWYLGVKATPEMPRYIIVGFQTNRAANQETNPSIFDHCDLKSIHAMIGVTKFPATDYNLSFPNQKFAEAFHDVVAFNQTFFGMDRLIMEGGIKRSEYKTLFPLILIDVSKQEERLKFSVVDIQIEAIFNTEVPAGTAAFAVVVSDRMLKFESDGGKMSVVY